MKLVLISVLMSVALQSAMAAQGMDFGAAGTVSKDCADCPEMVVIPAGRFAMGVAPGEEEREVLADQFPDRSQPPW